LKKIELLAPAKDLLCGKAAIDCGADAVYIGAPKFGARKSAANNINDIETLCQYAHLYYVRVYVAINTILTNKELDEAIQLIHQLYKIGVDAIIIQDLALLKAELPPIPLYASTQTNNYELERIKFLEKSGVDRVILARELSLQQIKNIANNTTVELEAFVHGALCVSYSGQCYISEAITKRSANKGECAQLCRLKYTLTDKNGQIIIADKYLLSLKDLNLSAHIQQLAEAGVSSFKIEGRLKDIYYVKNITAYYRQIIDELLKHNNTYQKASSGVTTFNFKPDPERTFNRGYTSYFLTGRRDHILSPDTPKSTGKFIGIIKEVKPKSITIQSVDKLKNGDGLCFFDKEGKICGFRVNKVEGNEIFHFEKQNLKAGMKLYRNQDKDFEEQLSNQASTRNIPISIKITETNNGIKINCSDDELSQVEKEFLCEKQIAKNPELAYESIKNQLSKTGNNIYTISEIVINFEKPYFFSTSVINGWRREILELLEIKRIENYPRIKRKNNYTPTPFYNKTIDYHENIANNDAKKFYIQAGVEQISEAYENAPPKTKHVVMTTKHCICEALGKCLLNHRLETPLFLSDGKNKYELEFDCKRCEMKVLL
jgi:23S rRNA 5-hydroxycytidine C2501 synthase